MKIIDVYTPFLAALHRTGSLKQAARSTESLSRFAKQADHWDIDWTGVEQWMKSPEYITHSTRTARAYLPLARALTQKVELLLNAGRELPGELHLVPSLQAFDGFARYDRGTHTVLLGIDYPDASLDYLRALTLHELSHVYRDHQPDVWGFLGKPLSQISRAEYLDASSAREHLVSEGLATLFSQLVFPEIEPALHHYYHPHEWDWCVQNHAQIDQALLATLHPPGDENVWKFYGDESAGPGSPPRTQYYWAAHRIREWLPDLSIRSIAIAHGWHADRFECFEP